MCFDRGDLQSMANKENGKNDILREQDEKKKQTLQELQELQSLLHKEPKEKKPKAVKAENPKQEEQKPKKVEEPVIEPTQTLGSEIYRRAQEEQEKKEEAERQERIRRTSSKKDDVEREKAVNHSEKEKKNNDAPRPVRKISREEAARRRKAKQRRMRIRLGGLIIVLLLIICAAVFAIYKATSSSQPSDTVNAAQAGSASTTANKNPEDEPVPNVDESLPASQQETVQYLKIKDDLDLPEYAKQYPGLYSDARSTDTVESDESVCYMTFDDGPSDTVTPQILDTLEAYDVNATFFLVGSNIPGNEELVKRMIDDGDTICIHCNVHEYETIYQTVETFLEDFAAAYDAIYEATGYRVQGFRFPGGSNNGYITSDTALYDAIAEEMTRRGFEYYDWNAYDGDAEGESIPEPASLASRAVDEVTMSARNDAILLMHDTWGKENTAAALPDIIEGLQNAGVKIRPITNETRPVHFEVNENTPSEYSGESAPAPVETTDGDEGNA